MNILRGDIVRLAKEKPITSEVHPLFVQKIKPFCEIPERESALYAYAKKIAFQDTPCPYASEALRNDIRGILNRMEESTLEPNSRFSRHWEADQRLRAAKKRILKFVLNVVSRLRWIYVRLRDA